MLLDWQDTLITLRENYWNPTTLFWSVFTFSWIVFFWDTYISWRQYQVCLKSTKLPLEMAGIMDRETFLKAREYSIDRTRFSLLASTWSQILSSIILLYDLMPLLWNYSGKLMARYGYDSSYEITQTLIFITIGSLISKIIDLPWSIYSTFVIQQKHGFNKQTPSFFAKDKAKKFIITQLISSPILAGVIYIIKIGGDYFFIYLWVFCSSIVFLMMTIYPDFIAPLFDKYMLLPEGSLREKIRVMANSIKFPLTQVYIVEGSKRSSHSNAYLYGFFNNKRIVLFDTLMENPPKLDDGKGKDQPEKTPTEPKDGVDSTDQANAEKLEANTEDKTTDPAEKEKDKKAPPKKGCNDDEILAILGHELGHWKLNHVVINLVIAEVQMFFTFMIFGLLYKDPVIYRAFGFTDQPVFIGLLVITQYIFSPYHEISGFLMTCLTRHHEFAADNFAKKMNRASDLRSALIKLGNDNLTFPIYDWLYSALNLSHPPLLERIKALGKID